MSAGLLRRLASYLPAPTFLTSDNLADSQQSGCSMAVSALSGYPTTTATISCVYCRAVLQFQGLPAVRYADHLSNEHRILFQQDDVITRTITTQMPGLLPRSPDLQTPCSCSLPRVKLERSPAGKVLALQSPSQSTATQTDTELEAVAARVLTLDVAVQTIATEGEFDVKPRVKIKSERRGTVETARVLGELLEGAVQGRVGSQYPCPACSQTFNSLYAVKLHALESHQAGQAGLGAIAGGRLVTKRIPLMKKKRKKKGLVSKKKPWCNYCWIKFKDQTSYQQHRRAVHPELVLAASAKKVEPSKLDTSSSKSPAVVAEEMDIEGGEMRNMEAKSGALAPSQPELDISMIGEELKGSSDRQREEASEVAAVPAIEESEVGGQLDTEHRMEEARLDLMSSEEEDEEEPVEKKQKVDEVEDELFPFPSRPVPSSSPIRLTKAEPKPSETCPEGDDDGGLVAACMLDGVGLRVKLGRRVDTRLQLDYEGRHLLSELEKLGCSVEQFQKEMGAVVGGGAAEQLAEPLPWYEVRTHRCLLCSSLQPLGSVGVHLSELHGMALPAYRHRFPQADFSVPDWTCRVCTKVRNSLLT